MTDQRVQTRDAPLLQSRASPDRNLLTDNVARSGLLHQSDLSVFTACLPPISSSHLTSSSFCLHPCRDDHYPTLLALFRLAFAHSLVFLFFLVYPHLLFVLTACFASPHFVHLHQSMFKLQEKGSASSPYHC